jgi:hypothetical protein
VVLSADFRRADLTTTMRRACATASTNVEQAARGEPPLWVVPELADVVGAGAAVKRR